MRYAEPFVPVPLDAIPVMLELASLQPGELLVDLGSGDGRIVIEGAEKFGALAVGVEVRGSLVKECRAKVEQMGLAGRVKIVERKFKDFSLLEADVLALYLSSFTLGLLAPKFEKELRRGSRVVTFDFQIFGWDPRREVSFRPRGWTKPHPIYLYVL